LQKGYLACTANSFDSAKAIIDSYFTE
jgi:hypothetical protein